MAETSVDNIVFVAAKRTPFGSFGGSYKDLTATDLAVMASQSAMAQVPGIEKYIDHVIFGNVVQTSKDASYLARHVALRLGLPLTVPAVTTNRLCGSGFEAIDDGIRRLRLKEASAVLVGGTESMSQSPYVIRSARFGNKFGHTEMEDSLMTGLFDTFAEVSMAITAENVAVKYGIDRLQSDTFALASQKKALAWTGTPSFSKEVTKVSLMERGKHKEVLIDEHIRKEASLEGLQKLKAVFKTNGVVTAGNASGMVDGATALIVTTKGLAQENNWAILGEWLGSHVVGCEPTLMGMGPVPAIEGLFKKTGMAIKDIARFEINEAFAPQVLACQKLLEIPISKLNVEGGAIAIGHPLGASGARLIAHLLYQLNSGPSEIGCAAACIGGGQGMALLIRA